MSSGPSLVGNIYKPKRDPSEPTNIFSLDVAKPFYRTESQDLNNSKIEFLENQTNTEEDSFITWRRISLALNTLTILFAIALAVVWFSWLNKDSRPDIQCVNLKNQIIWVIVVYIIGIFCQTLGIFSGHLKSAIGFLIYQALLIALFIVRIVLDIPTINAAVSNLEGCAATVPSIAFSDYIYGTIFYCILIVVLFTCNIKMIRRIRRLKKTQRIQSEYIKSEKFVSSHI